MAGWTLNPGPVPLGSGIGITVFLLIFCAKCHTSSVHWRRYCVRSDPTWSRTAEHMESVHGYLWEKRVPVEATFRGVWGQGDWGTVALCLLHSWCLLPVPARSWVFVSPPGPACGCQSALGKGPGDPTPSGMCVLGEQSLCLWLNGEGWTCVGILSAVGGDPGYALLVCSDLQCNAKGHSQWPTSLYAMQPARKISCPLQNKERCKRTVQTHCGIYKLLSRCLCYIYIYGLPLITHSRELCKNCAGRLTLI